MENICTIHNMQDALCCISLCSRHITRRHLAPGMPHFETENLLLRICSSLCRRFGDLSLQAAGEQPSDVLLHCKRRDAWAIVLVDTPLLVNKELAKVPSNRSDARTTAAKLRVVPQKLEHWMGILAIHKAFVHDGELPT